ncbi:MAG: hydrogenase expression/formation protein HypD [Dehalococcoidales bacterium]|nr:hydrogenase expression/formation protein HypD [Dehalococcoidales bacterium]
MRFIDEFRDSAAGQSLVLRIQKKKTPAVNLMEVCGTHTVAIFKHGIRQLLPETVNLISGPGCPVCVTPNADIDKAIALAQNAGIILVTFGDMIKVPGSYSSLNQIKAAGADIRVVYSVLDALRMAEDNPRKSVVFFGVGFETTAPTTASAILEAERGGLDNFFLLSVHKVMPPAMKLLLDADEVHIDGFICPGHVSTIIGSEPYEFIPRQYGIPCVITGFEPLDILQGIDMLLEQVANGEPRVAIQYRRAVRPEGNPVALKYLATVFEVTDARWRGIGIIPGSGLKLGQQYRRFDAEHAFNIVTRPPKEAKGCRCGDVLRGVCLPAECHLFGKACTPEHPSGPCMVSTEGTCSAWYLYRGKD